MVRDQGMEPSIEHKLCLMDLLGHTGWIEEAEEFLASSEDLKARAASWTSFLSACERQSEQGRAGRAASVFHSSRTMNGSINVQAGTSFVDFVFQDGRYDLVCVYQSHFSKVRGLWHNYACIALAGVTIKFLNFRLVEGGYQTSNSQFGFELYIYNIEEIRKTRLF
ncbi:hypothetical protein SELMODRAFT_408124 [Selaginella moellendorffii]|uniref:Uncharacterized protein n=1 Tax=Selaginella moellendorffii TaxID=88036 RepID=D8R797_SELML|nr:hypothetical protein SELMODRAFT_408124 [Selaginella moellendorffii]